MLAAALRPCARGAVHAVQDIMIQQAKVGLTGSDQARLTTAQHLLAGSLAGGCRA